MFYQAIRQEPAGGRSARPPVRRMLGLPGRSGTHDGDVTFTARIDLWLLSGLWSKLRSKRRPGSPFASSLLELDSNCRADTRVAVAAG
jgi:hypothetical protein